MSRGEVSTAPSAVDEMLKLGGLQLQPKTPEQRLQRMLTTPRRTRPYGISVDQALWRLVDEPSGSVMDKLVVESPIVRGPILRAAHSAIERGEKAILDAALGQTNLRSTEREAIRPAIVPQRKRRSNGWRGTHNL